jgi:hypothetical protein
VIVAWNVTTSANVATSGCDLEYAAMAWAGRKGETDFPAVVVRYSPHIDANFWVACW